MPAQAWVTLSVGVLAVVGVALTVRLTVVADRTALLLARSSDGEDTGDQNEQEGPR